MYYRVLIVLKNVRMIIIVFMITAAAALSLLCQSTVPSICIFWRNGDPAMFRVGSSKATESKSQVLKRQVEVVLSSRIRHRHHVGFAYSSIERENSLLGMLLSCSATLWKSARGDSGTTSYECRNKSESQNVTRAWVRIMWLLNE